MKIKQERKNIMKTAVKENKKNKMTVLCGKLKENIKNFWQDEDGMGVVEIVLIIVGILTTYYGVSIRCIG